jgi:hypothetical protein
MPKNLTGNKTRMQGPSMTVALIAALALPATLWSMPKDENSEWAKALAGASSGQNPTAVPETKSAEKAVKTVAAKKDTKEPGSKKATPPVGMAAAKPKAQPNEWAQVTTAPITSAAKSEPEKSQAVENSSPSQTEEVVTVAKSEWEKALAALEKEARSAQGPAAEVAKVEVQSSSSAKSESKAAESKHEEAAQSEPTTTVAKAENNHLPALVDDAKSEPGAGESGDAGLQSTINRWKEKFSKVTYGTELEGFFDSSLSNRRNNPHVISAGAFEADFSKAFGKSFQSAAAVVVTPGSRPEFPVAFVDYHFFGGMIAPRGRLFTEKGFHVQAGRFDIPFGNDWQYFASKDRITVTPPLTTDLVMQGGYNDKGLRVLGNSRALNYTAYALRGVGNGVAYGGRVGFTPFSNPYQLRTSGVPKFELGASYLFDADGFGRTDQRAQSLDFESQVGWSHLMVEYTRRDSHGFDFENLQSKHSGFHVTQAVDLAGIFKKPLVATFRFERYWKRFPGVLELDPETGEAPETVPSNLNRLTAGIQYPLSELFILKLDYLQFIRTPQESLENEELGRRAVYAQLVFQF